MTKLGCIAVALALGALLSSCASPENSYLVDGIETRPDLAPSYTNSWSAAPGIDLFSRGGELVRASLEASMQTTLYSQKKSFPGYREAIGYPDNADRDITWDVESGMDRKDKGGEFTIRYHITELIESPTEITASICDDTVHTETIINRDITNHGVSWTVSLRNTADTPGLPGIVDTDPNNHDSRARRTPDWNIFGTWEIVRLVPRGLNTVVNSAEPACTNWWLANHPDTLKVGSNYTFRAPGVVSGTPRAPQYPEWIGPSEPQ